jgi:hypothetical protein
MALDHAATSHSTTVWIGGPGEEKPNGRASKPAEDWLQRQNIWRLAGTWNRP